MSEVVFPEVASCFFAVLTETSRGLRQIEPRLGHLRFLITYFCKKDQRALSGKFRSSETDLYGSLPANVSVNKPNCVNLTQHTFIVI
jgi:hypothetical protein